MTYLEITKALSKIINSCQNINQVNAVRAKIYTALTEICKAKKSELSICFPDELESFFRDEIQEKDSNFKSILEARSDYLESQQF